MRAFDNFSDARQAVYDNVLEAAKAIKPVEFGGRKLEIVNAFYDPNDEDDDNNEAFTPAAQARAVYEEKTVGRRLRGVFRMTDMNTGKYEETPTTLALVPRVNEDATNIYRGSRYVVVNQQRLKPGVFSRVKKNSNVEAYINADKQTGLTHRVVFKPERSMFYLNVGNSHVPLASLLRTMGTSDDEMREAWGEEIAKANIAAAKDVDINKIYDRLVRSKDKVKDADPETKRRIIAQAIQSTSIDPWVTKRTLGLETDKLSPQVFLKATQKSLDMLRGNIQGDDRDSLSSQQVKGVEDLFSERIRLDSGFDQRNAFRKALARNNINAVPRRLLQRQLEEVLFGSGVAIQPDNANPLQAWDLATRITKMGEGAIGSSTAVPMESRDFHGSHIGFIDPSRTVESLKVGVDLNLAANAVKGKDGRVYTPLKNVKTGQIEYKSAEEVSDLIVAPQMHEDIPGFINAVKNGDEDYYSPDEIEYVIPDVESGFSGVSNLIPGKLMQPQNRTAMGARFITQSIPLVNREAPLVQAAVPGTNKGMAFNRLYNSRVGVVSAKSPGVVKAVSKDQVVVTHSGEDGQPVDRVYHLHESTPIGPKTALANTPTVKVGDQVDKDTVLATSNYADAKGDIAIGLNARMALMPWKDNYEDAYVVSQSFAKRMTSEQNYSFKSYADPAAVTKSDKFVSVLPSEYNKAQLSKLDGDGVVKIGQKVTNGDPLVLSAGIKDVNMSKPLAKSGHRAYVNNSQTWEHDDEGVVTGVHRDKRGNIHVSVQTQSAMVDGDKIAEFFGSKGVVRVIPDDQMVHDSQGRPFDVVASDLGTISRQNSSRAVALLLGKVAEKTGTPYLIDESDPNVDYRDIARAELEKYGISDKETVVDPRNGRQIPGVLAGPQYIMKLTHLAESKAHARSSGVYASDETPSKGSEEGMQAKRVSNQELGALIAHGATNLLHEIAAVKGAKSTEYMARYLSGKDLPTPQVPFVYRKFLTYLEGMGVNPVRNGSKTRLYLMTDREITERTGNRVVTSDQTVDLGKNLKPISGGLFDPSIFGDDGKRMARYELSTPIPHPMMRKPLQKIMGLTENQFRDLIGGKHELPGFGTGVEGMQKWLENLDLPAAQADARRKIQSGARTTRDKAIQQLKYLTAIEKHGLTPDKLILKSVPIIPPVYRPVSKLDGNDVPLIDGLNLLYQQMIQADKNVKAMSQYSARTGDEKLALYDTVQAVTGLEEPADPELRQKAVKGIMRRLVGGSPKTSFVQSKLLSGTVDHVARAVVVPSSDLKLDEIGVPESQAWEIFKFPVMRAMTKRGIPLERAKAEIDAKSPMARQALVQEMDYRPVTASRAPVLHKYGMLGFRAKMVPGHTLQMNPLVHAGYNLDHDGNCFCSGEKVVLEVSWSTLYSDEIGSTWISSLQKATGMRLLADSKLAVDGLTRHVIRIGDLPITDRLISEIGNQRIYALPKGLRVLSYDHTKNSACWSKVDSLTVESGHRTVNVSYSNGRKVAVSDNESLAVIDLQSFEIVRRKPEDTVALITPSVKQSPLPKVTGEAKSFDDGWLYGALLANGWTSDRMVGYSKCDDTLLAHVENLCRKITVNFACKRYEDKAGESKFADSVKIHMNGVDLASQFCSLTHPDMENYRDGNTWVEPRLGDDPWSETRVRGALFKHVDAKFTAGYGREAWLGFVCGYLENDGTMTRQSKPGRTKAYLDRVRINTSSPYLLEDIQLVLRYLGVRVSVAYKQATATAHPGYGLELSLPDVWDISSELRFVSSAANEWLSQFKSSPRPTDRRDQVPVPDIVVSALEKLSGTDISTARSKLKEYQWLSRDLCRKIASALPPAIKEDAIVKRWIAAVKATDIYWYRVDSVEEKSTSETVYDLGVPETKVFCLNSGLVVYDTMNFHATITDEAVKEVNEKMLPSKNLFAASDFKTPMNLPRQDHALGLWLASTAKDDSQKEKVFRTINDAAAAFQRNEINVNTPIKILE